MSDDRVQGQACFDVPRLLQQFESLGENCDLGVVQRAVGLEPFGLFRFSACKAQAVAELLASRFEQLCEPDDLWLDVVGERREYWVKSRHTPFEAHTNRYADRHDAETVRQGELDRMRYLKTHLLADLERGKKLFVFKGTAELATLRQLATELQRYGRNCLLWINVSDAAHPPGNVERDSDTLLLGYVSRFGTYEDAPSLPIAEWVRVCAQAYRLWRGEEPPKALCTNLLDQGLEWRADPGAATALIEAEGPARARVFAHRLNTDTHTAVCSTFLPLANGGSFTLSAWVRLAADFDPRSVSVLLPGFDSVAIWTADPSTRASWQRIWVHASVPREATAIVCALFAQGPVGGEFRSSAWALERGTRPSGYGFDL